MSLYHEAAALIQETAGQGGSLKSRIYTNKTLSSSPKQLFALVTEVSKWSNVLKEVVENSGLLKAERKVDEEVTFPLKAKEYMLRLH